MQKETTEFEQKIMTKEEFNHYTSKLVKLSFMAIILPLTASLLAYTLEYGSPLYFFLVGETTMALGHHLFNIGPREKGLFNLLAIVAIVMFFFGTIATNAVNKTHKDNPPTRAIKNQIEYYNEYSY